MLGLKYSLIIEATADPTFFSFYSPTLEGFTGVGHSIEDCTAGKLIRRHKPTSCCAWRAA